MPLVRQHILFIGTILIVLFSQCMLKGSSIKNEIPFQLVDGLIVVEATVNQEKGQYIFDTGSPYLIINGSVDSKDSEISSLDYEHFAEDIVVHDFSLANISKRAIGAMKVDASFLKNHVGYEVDGLIGMSALQGYSVFIDYEENKLVFLNEESSLINQSYMHYRVSSIDYQLLESRPVVNINIGQKLYKMILDSGANANVIHQNSSLATNDESLFSADEIKLNNITITNIDFLQRDLSFVNEAGNDFKIDGILSIDGMNVDKVLFDATRGKVFLFWKQSETEVTTSQHLVASLD